jgi:hypothetical protein
LIVVLDINASSIFNIYAVASILYSPSKQFSINLYYYTTYCFPLKLCIMNGGTSHGVGSLGFDVVIIGASISGMNTAYRIKTRSPKENFVVFEDRADLGGTWDLFNYPGIRSDSDFYTFGFAWSPWMGGTTLAEKPKIIEYFKKAVKNEGLEDRIRFQHRVIAVNWSSKQMRWTLDVQVAGQESVVQYSSCNHSHDINTGFSYT